MLCYIPAFRQLVALTLVLLLPASCLVFLSRHFQANSNSPLSTGGSVKFLTLTDFHVIIVSLWSVCVRILLCESFIWSSGALRLRSVRLSKMWNSTLIHSELRTSHALIVSVCTKDCLNVKCCHSCNQKGRQADPVSRPTEGCPWGPGSPLSFHKYYQYGLLLVTF